MALVALLVSIASFAAAAFSAWYARQSAATARETARSAKDQAKAATDQAAAEKAQLTIERQRFHDELTPALVGSVRSRPSWRGGPIEADHILEVRVTTGPPLAGLTLRLPPGTHIGRRSPSIGQHDLFSQEAGEPIIRPGHPAIWDVVVGDQAPTSFIATADCRDEYGERWLDVEVEVKLEDS